VGSHRVHRGHREKASLLRIGEVPILNKALRPINSKKIFIADRDHREHGETGLLLENQRKIDSPEKLWFSPNEPLLFVDTSLTNKKWLR
jgi:hypothetical protein